MNFCFVVHNHQPVGQLPWAFEDAWRDSYAPFLQVLSAHPTIKAGLHFSGPLLDWLAENKPETISRVREMVARGQVEILCGGFYEPIFAVWPREDALAQIEKSQVRISELFGMVPRGMWLTERVWESQLAPWLAAAGAQYVLLDSTLFEAAGLAEGEMHGAFKIEDTTLRTFPINRTLRDLIPWREPWESIEYLRQCAMVSGDGCVVFGDDGEKFGAWPGTFEWVFEKGWLDRFFTALEKESDWLQSVTPCEYLSQAKPEKSLQLPDGSYPEMQLWSGGNWRNFLTRYRESRDMQEEVLRTRTLAEASQNAAALGHVLRAQSNDAYWHGVFGGLYLKHLRQAVYRECAAAQVLVRGKEPFVHCAPHGADSILENEQLRLGARANGGHLFLLTSQKAQHNLLATLRRYKEPYHDAHANGHISEDWYPRGALLDHFFAADATPEEFASARYREEGDFLSEDWEVSQQLEWSAGNAAPATGGVLTLARAGGVWHEGLFAPLRIEKRIHLRAGSGEIGIEYSFRNLGDKPLSLWWGTEWNAVLSGVDLPERHYHAADHSQKLDLQETAEFESVTNPIAADNWLGLWLEWKFPQPISMWHVPLFTTSQKEGGHIERIYQQSCFVFHRRLELAARSEYSLAFGAVVTTK